MNNFVAPSLLAADKTKLLDEIKLVENEGCEYLHWDVMDGVFVPNTSYTVEDVSSFAKKHKMINDVHIMVANPKEEAIKFAKAGADIVTFHIEAVNCPVCAGKIINSLHALNCKAGISIKPGTKVKAIEPLLDKVDLVLVMSVEPGFGGQKFMPIAIDKINELRKLNKNIIISVDGGINDETVRMVNTDMVVSGSYVCMSDNFEKNIEILKK